MQAATHKGKFQCTPPKLIYAKIPNDEVRLLITPKKYDTSHGKIYGSQSSVVSKQKDDPESSSVLM